MKGKKADFSQANCGISRALQVVGDWWTFLIVRDAFRGNQRFSEFEKSVGAAKNILSARLKKLVEEGVMRIEAVDDAPQSKRYLLTPKGEQLCVALVALWQWGDEHCSAPDELTVEMVDAVNEQPLGKLSLVASDGRVVGPKDFRVMARAKKEVSVPRKSAKKRVAE